MTVTNDSRRIRYEGNNAALSFTYDFPIFSGEDLLVVLTDPDGRETELTLGVDFSVSGAGEEGGGSITCPLSGDPLKPGYFLTIVRNLSFTQAVDIQNQGAWLPEVVEGALDRLTMLSLQLLEANDRTLRHSVGSSAADAVLPNAAGAGLLGFGETGHLVVYPVATEAEKTKAVYGSAADTTGGYLTDKISAGMGVTFTTVDPSGNESITIAAPTAGRVSEEDTTPGFLSEKLTPGEGVTLTVNDIGDNESLTVAAPDAGKVFLSGDDSVSGFLTTKLLAGSGVTFAESAPGADERLTLSVAGGGLRNVLIITSNSTYTKPAWLKLAEVFVVGGGAGGSYGERAGGGGSGGAAMKLLAAADIGSSETVTVGTGGSGGTSSDKDGSAGGASSFGSHVAAGGGLTADTTGLGGAGGTATLGDVLLSGGCGGTRFYPTLSLTGPSYCGGAGGAAPGPYGGGAVNGSATDGLAGAGYGSGGSGGGYYTDGDTVFTHYNGGAGKGGVVVVREYSL